MGPSMIVDGDSAHRSGCLRHPCGFNGAVDDRRRRRRAPGRVGLPRGCFNGAVDDRRRRRPGPPAERERHVRHASMGPSMIVDGDSRRGTGCCRRAVASMGPSMIVDGDAAHAAQRRGLRRASMGPSMIVDGDAPLGRGGDAARARFNGAVDDRRRRRLVSPALWTAMILLQWGRR